MSARKHKIVKAKALFEERFWDGDLFIVERHWSDGVIGRNEYSVSPDYVIQRCTVRLNKYPGFKDQDKRNVGHRLHDFEIELKSSGKRLRTPGIYEPPQRPPEFVDDGPGSRAPLRFN